MILAGVAPAAVGHALHGTAIAADAALEHRGTADCMIITRGDHDVIHAGRRQRPRHCSIQQRIPWQVTPLVKRRHRRGVPDRPAPPTGGGAGAAGIATAGAGCPTGCAPSRPGCRRTRPGCAPRWDTLANSMPIACPKSSAAGCETVPS